MMIAIIGGGPSGAYLAYLLAKAGKNVGLFEEHEKIGLPVQCSGVVTSSLEKILDIRKQFVVNKINKFRLVSPVKKFVDLDFKKANIVLDRKEFDRFLVEKAKNAGAKVYLGKKFVKGRKIGKYYSLEFADGTKVDCNKVVGADGPHSSVAKSFGLYGKREFVTGVQARVSLDHDPKMIEVWFDKDYFGWVIPEDGKVARLGIISSGRPNIYFKRFLDFKGGKVKIREYQSGVVPVYNPKLKISKDGVFLLGDAAMQVKASSYGGIVYGLMAAEELSKVILKGKGDYGKRCRRRFGRELRYSLRIRKMLDKFSSKDYDKLVSLFRSKRVRKVLEKYDRDYPSKIAFRLAFREPRFFGFVRKGF